MIHSQVSIRERVVVGNRVTLHNGVVVGSDGFGFARQKDGTHLKIPQHADVVIEDDVEIGANSTIDRPAIGETRISAGTKIDNLVHIAHGVSVGRRGLLAAQVGIAGSTIIEDDVMMAGQSGVTGHVRIGARRESRREERGAAIGRRRGVRHRASGLRARRLAESVRRLPPAAGAEEAGGRARATHRRTRGEARCMPAVGRSLVFPIALAACLLLVATAGPVAAQPQPVVAPAPAAPEFLHALRLSPDHATGLTDGR